jgi:hypothetical protein
MNTAGVEARWAGVRRWWARLDARRSPRWGRGRGPGVLGAPGGAGGARWDPQADARERALERLAAAGARLQAEHHRLRAERALDVIDLGAHERLAQADRAHQVALRRFRTAPGRVAAAPSARAVMS